MSNLKWFLFDRGRQLRVITGITPASLHIRHFFGGSSAFLRTPRRHSTAKQPQTNNVTALAVEGTKSNLHPPDLPCHLSLALPQAQPKSFSSTHPSHLFSGPPPGRSHKSAHNSTHTHTSPSLSLPTRPPDMSFLQQVYRAADRVRTAVTGDRLWWIEEAEEEEGFDPDNTPIAKALRAFAAEQNALKAPAGYPSGTGTAASVDNNGFNLSQLRIWNRSGTASDSGAGQSSSTSQQPVNTGISDLWGPPSSASNRPAATASLRRPGLATAGLGTASSSSLRNRPTPAYDSPAGGSSAGLSPNHPSQRLQALLRSNSPASSGGRPANYRSAGSAPGR